MWHVEQTVFVITCLSRLWTKSLWKKPRCGRLPRNPSSLWSWVNYKLRHGSWSWPWVNYKHSENKGGSGVLQLKVLATGKRFKYHQLRSSQGEEEKSWTNKVNELQGTEVNHWRFWEEEDGGTRSSFWGSNPSCPSSSSPSHAPLCLSLQWLLVMWNVNQSLNVCWDPILGASAMDSNWAIARASYWRHIMLPSCIYSLH